MPLAPSAFNTQNDPYFNKDHIKNKPSLVWQQMPSAQQKNDET